MIQKVIDINIDYSKIGREKEDYQPKLYAYIPNDGGDVVKFMPKRPSMLILPGGGYRYTSDREADPIAMFYLSKGYNCFILRYSCAPSHFPVQLAEAGKALLTIKENAEEWLVDLDKIFVCGFSAGGHLAASLGVFWDKPFLADILGTTNDMLKFKALVLGYPVITYKPVLETTDENRTCGGTIRTFINLLGEEKYAIPSEAEYHCLDTQVSENTPPCFIWSTFEDATVPVECSLLFALALRKHDIPVELHIYEHGRHGQSTGTTVCCNSNQRLANWMEMSYAWLEEEHGLPQV
ncbi:MAG: alpha/beta hydrolase [Clostridia bacterium]|nr:alpha/beta hydrolase [Clostridia bacterium]